MNSKESIALSSLAIGVGAASLLGVSGISEAGDDPAYCDQEWDNCYLGFWPELSSQITIAGGLENIPQQYHQYLFTYITFFVEGYPSGAHVYGSCEMAPMASYPPEELFCGCAGEALQYHATINPYWSGSGLSFTADVTLVATPLFDYHDSQCWYP